MRDRVSFRGHPMVRSLHPTTIEVTTEESLTERGDCIIGVGADKGCQGLDPGLKDAIRRDGAKVTMRVVVGAETFEVTARGSSQLELSHPHDIVLRRSSFVSDRTVALGASAAAKDLPRSMVRLLRDPRTRGTIELEVS